MPVQQKQNIKGFTLLELIVIVAIIGLLSAVAYPKFSNWSRDRAVKLQSEKIANLLTSATTQVERGYYAYVKVEFEKDTAPSQITVKGINQVDFSKKINGPKDPTCKSDDFTSSQWKDISSHTLDENTFSPALMPIVSDKSKGSGATICFSKGGKYFKQTGSANGRQPIKAKPDSSNYIVLCHNFTVSTDPKLKAKGCSPPVTFDNKYPTYAIVYSRFGLITKYKWKGSWINQ